MFLRQIELKGFKSFPEPTTIELSPRITVIVGPNGCGKSNIADALRWVLLGEATARPLRGLKMEDIIFQGTERRKPLGMAEVSLLFDNAGGVLPIDFAEVRATRRVFRSGEHEYVLNRVPCRLRDLQDLFQAAGFGRDGLAIIAQGMVEDVLHARPEGRRMVLEEVAGIARYRRMKQEAVKKLEETERQLERLSDVLAEVEREVDFWAKEAALATRFLAAEEELKLLELALARREARRLFAHKESIGRQKEKLGQKILESEKEKEQLTRSLIEIGRQREQLRGEGETIRAEEREVLRIIEELRANLEEKEKKMEMLDRQRKEAEILLNELQERHRRRQQELCSAALWRNRSARRAEKRREVALRRREIVEIEKNNHQMISSSLREMESALGEVNTKRERLVLELVKLDQEEAFLSTSRKELAREAIEFKNTREKLRGRLRSLTGEYERAARDLEKTKSERERLLEKEKRLGDEARSLRELAVFSSEQYQKALSRYETLQGLVHSFEGYSPGARAVLNARSLGDERCREVLGAVADLMEIPAPYIVPVEAVLGPGLSYIVVRSLEGARLAGEVAKEKKAGRVTFLPLDVLKPPAPAHIPSGEGVIGSAASVVEVVPEARPAVEFLLGKTILVSDLARGRNILPSLPPGTRLVTMDGEVLTWAGVFITGKIPRGTGVITRRAELRALSEDLLNQEARARQLKIAWEEKERELRGVVKERADKDAELISLTGQVRGMRAELQSLQRELNEKSGEMELLRAKRREIDEKLAELSSNRQRLVFELNKTKAAEEKLGRELELTKREEQEQSLRLAKATSRLSRTEARLLASLRMAEQADKTVQRMGQELSQLENSIERKRVALCDLEEELSPLRNEVECLRADLDRMENRHQEIKLLLETKSRMLEERERMWEDALYREKKNAERSLHLQKQLGALSVQEAEVGAALRSLAEKWGDLALDAGAEELDLSAVQQKKEELQSLIQSFGPVNRDAPQQWRRVESRRDYWRQQYDELASARKDLLVAVKEIDSEMAKRLVAAVQGVNEALEEIFPRLFGGGQAKLLLTGSDDVLEGGVEIEVRIPGKKVKNIALLSGGEKSLTAIAVLFACLKYRPLPFCVLDEVDSSLDEANLVRFAGLLEEFAAHTQFMVISHRQATMERGDVLYGITMEEPGVSKVVSIRMIKGEGAYVAAASSRSGENQGQADEDRRSRARISGTE